MKRSLCYLAVFLLLAVSTTPLFALTGKVVNVDGKPVPMAKVIVTTYQSPKMQEKTFKADENGKVTSEDSHPPMLVLDKGGNPIPYALVTRPVVIGPQRQIKPQEATLYTDAKGGFSLPAAKEPLQEYKIQVQYADGKPAPQANLVMADIDQGQRHSIAIMDDKGEFHRSASSGHCRAVATAAGYTYAVENGPNRSDQPMTLQLGPGQNLRGRIVDEAGKPVEGAKVAMVSLYASPQNGTSLSIHGEKPVSGLSQPVIEAVATGKDGRFTLLHLPDSTHFQWGVVTLAATKEGRASVNKKLQLADMGKELVIRLPAECKVEGILYSPNKAGAVPDTGIEVSVSSKDYHETQRARTDQSGRFSIGKLPPGKACLQLSSSSQRYDSQGAPIANAPQPGALPVVEFDLASGKTRSLELVMTPGAIVKGVVIEGASGKPVSHAQMFIKHGGVNPISMGNHIPTNDKGEFETRVVAGSVKVTVDSFNFDGEFRHFQYEDRPEVSFAVEEKQEKSDLIVKVSLADTNQPYVYGAQPPDDFELMPGTYDLKWDPDLNCRRALSGYMVESGSRAVANITNMPKLISDNARRAAFKFDGTGEEGYLVAVFDESKGTGKGWDTAYIDMNRNNDLTDDEPIHWAVVKDNSRVYTPWFVMQPREGLPFGNPAQARVSVTSQSGDNANLYLELQRKGAWRGSVDSSKGKVECVLLDSNANGVYGDPTSVQTDSEFRVQYGDSLYVDTTGQGCAVLDPSGPHSIGLCEVSQLAGKFYSIRPENGGSKIVIDRYAEPVGRLNVKAEDINGLSGTMSAVMISGNAGHYWFPKSNGKPLNVPEGRYRITHLALDLQDRNGKKLALSGSVKVDVEVMGDRETTASIEGKLSLALNPEMKQLITFKRGDQHKINYDIRIGDMTVSKVGDGSPTYKPKVTFYNAKGKLTASVDAGYT